VGGHAVLARLDDVGRDQPAAWGEWQPVGRWSGCLGRVGREAVSRIQPAA
jgi:hypothetical protein